MSLKKVLSKFALKVVYRCKVIGAENMPKDGSVLVCCNHVSNNDVIIMACALPRQVNYMAKKELFKFKPFGNFLRSLGAFPVDRKTGDVGALKHSMKMINEGNVVGIFPQGARRKHIHPAETPVRGGAGMIVTRTGTTVLPMSIRTKNDRIIPFFRKVVLNIGKPMEIGEFADIAGEDNRYNLVSERIFARILDLYEESVVKIDKKPE